MQGQTQEIAAEEFRPNSSDGDVLSNTAGWFQTCHPHHLLFADAGLRPSKATLFNHHPLPILRPQGSWAARPPVSGIFQCRRDGFTTNASIWTEKGIRVCVCVCVCVHYILYTHIRTPCIGCQFIPDLLEQPQFSHTWIPQTIEIS